MKKWLVLLGSMIMVLQIFLVPVEAGEVDILIDKLVEKGILSKEDAQEVMKEVKGEAKKERDAVVQETKAALQKDGTLLTAELPGWIRNTKFKGDLRLRYQYNERQGDADRHRGRYRLRLGLVTEVNDKIKVHFGLATGSNDPRSTNQTMDDTFDTDDIRLDYAYASYKPYGWVEIIGGKFKNPIWRTSGLMWDSDIRPEGAAATFKRTCDNVELFLMAGVWVLDDRSSEESDPMMFVLQPGMKVGLGENAYFKNAVTFYGFNNVKGYELEHSSDSNSRDADGGYKHDFDSIAYSAELGMYTSIDGIPFCALYGDAINNTDTSNDDVGYLIGFKFGDKKVSKPCQWQAKMSYRRLERDAWLDTFPNADAYSGETNVKGYHLAVKYGLLKHVFSALNYYNTKRIKGDGLRDHILQADVIFKF
jgi:hypothetical protein